MLNEEKQHAVDIVVEGRAAAHDPEDREGDLPQLQSPKTRASFASMDRLDDGHSLSGESRNDVQHSAHETRTHASEKPSPP
jgi:hypothetical protein